MQRGLAIQLAIILFARAVAVAMDPVELASFQDQRVMVTIDTARVGQEVGVAVWFDCTEDLHLYADPSMAPSAQSVLQVHAESQGIRFGRPVFPTPRSFHDQSLGREIQVFGGRFAVFLPLSHVPDGPFDVKLTISGMACTSQVCLPPFTKTITAKLDPSGDVQTLSLPTKFKVGLLGPIIFYLPMALLAGLSINVMPCVLPVLPLIVLRLVKQSTATHKQRLTSGLAFCIGMVGFFALLAAVAIVVNLATGRVLDINGLFRYQGTVIALFLVFVLLALVLFDVITINLPSALAGRIGDTGHAASFGTGFLAALLGIPCSGALLGFVMVWAQTQPIAVSATVMITIGIGMAIPYAVLMAAPGLVQRLPRPGRWMELFKKSCGFLILLIAVKLTLTGLPRERLIGLLFYTVVFAFCVWIWGNWVGRSTPTGTRWLIRATAVVIAVLAGLYLLPEAKADLIAWQAYDRQLVAQALREARPVLLKFTADWCTNCGILDRLVYNDRQVAQMIVDKGVLAIKADTTLHDAPATVDLGQVYGQAGGVPVTILLSPDGHREVLRGIFGKERLLGLLRALPERDHHEQGL